MVLEVFMLRKFLIVLFFIVCLLQISAFAYTHKLRRDWFNDDLAGIKKGDNVQQAQNGGNK